MRGLGLVRIEIHAGRVKLGQSEADENQMSVVRDGLNGLLQDLKDSEHPDLQRDGPICSSR